MSHIEVSLIKVTYYNGFERPQKGIIKSIDLEEKVVFVVYNCADDWNNYTQYTACGTPVKYLIFGWIWPCRSEEEEIAKFKTIYFNTYNRYFKL